MRLERWIISSKDARQIVEGVLARLAAPAADGGARVAILATGAAAATCHYLVGRLASAFDEGRIGQLDLHLRDRGVLVVARARWAAERL